ncbi:anti-sigma factor domain-containing protein [Paenibacillus sp. PL91]|uniref:anti-sigma factor domain-containing protein n=1 Tax=Paenibacillus sp. PL91 TaxID=2729538 RepID=UPI00145FA603|nr:anti-sigma factor domain-containing protein [Paenibacillus sp. PL91]MBC9202424.1 anti-sigma factor domain-containing protein [Paenibacillus sp. PL91]
MKRGVVMSIHKQHAVVMTADGQFLQAPIQGKTEIGEEITFEEEYRKPRTFKAAYWYTSAAAIMLLVFLPFLLMMQQDKNPVVAYVSMDINPSVELGVDKNDKVRELSALNEDGRLIIEGLEYEGVNVETVAASILERAKGSHYLDTPNKNIFITSMLLDDNSALKLDYEQILTGKVDRTLRNLLKQLAAEAASANITTLSVPNEVREEAAANGISSGKMAVYLMAKDEGYTIEMEQLKQNSIDKATESLGGLKTIVDNAEGLNKEKLKELVAREKEEKAKQQKADQNTNTAKPAATPKSNKPVKATKPEKPVSSEVNNAAVTTKPGKNGTLDNKPATTPGKSNKPNSPNRPNVDNKDDKNKEKDKDKDKDKEKEKEKEKEKAWDRNWESYGDEDLFDIWNRNNDQWKYDLDDDSSNDNKDRRESEDNDREDGWDDKKSKELNKEDDTRND